MAISEKLANLTDDLLFGLLSSSKSSSLRDERGDTFSPSSMKKLDLGDVVGTKIELRLVGLSLFADDDDVDALGRLLLEEEEQEVDDRESFSIQTVGAVALDVEALSSDTSSALLHLLLLFCVFFLLFLLILLMGGGGGETTLRPDSKLSATDDPSPSSTFSFPSIFSVESNESRTRALRSLLLRFFWPLRLVTTEEEEDLSVIGLTLSFIMVGGEEDCMFGSFFFFPIL